MGLDIYQNAIAGVKLSLEDIKKVISPAIYENQPRYDTKTGELKRHERVLVKEEKSVYKVGPYEFKNLWDIQFFKKDNYKLYVNTKDDFIYIGLEVPIGLDENAGIDGEILNGSISLMKLESVMVEVKNKLFDLGLRDLESKVELHFFTDISC